MASKRIDELTARTVVNTDLLPPTPSGGPSGSATVAAVVAAGLSQPNSASAGAGADLTIKAADGVTSGKGGSIILQVGAQATTGGSGTVRSTGNFTLVNGSDEATLRNQYGDLVVDLNFTGQTCNLTNFLSTSVGNHLKLIGRQGSGGGSVCVQSNTATISTNQNNYSLTTSGFQRVNCTSASNITGIASTGGAHPDGRMVRVVNIGAANLTLKHNDSSSTAANRMYMASGADIVLAQNQWAELVYDGTDNGSGAAGWRVYQ